MSDTGFPDRGNPFRFASADKLPQTKRPHGGCIEDRTGCRRAEQRENGDELHWG